MLTAIAMDDKTPAIRVIENFCRRQKIVQLL